ncbi:serine hydrolase [Mongoliitalea daihaiensis]|uniref:serine hydrolase n=1 Tax=Mongoliitalea daihaiensis TaxID=2782006 RepID=UPI001F296632|nr:serine hydrolase [Mongoliitalea daihaiensis]UJP66454.1 serine hydrolase [Mongoliitalea daihaiensis]
MKIRRILLSLVLFPIYFSGIAQSTSYKYTLSLPPTINVSYHIRNQSPPYNSINHEGSKQIPAASLIKIPILIAFLEQVDAGLLDLDQVHIIQEKEIVGGAGELQFDGAGQQLSMEKLLHEMIRTSDNTATNILINYLGMPLINESIERWGIKQTSLNRLMMDFEAIEAGRQNYTTVQNLVQLLEKVWKGELLSEHSKAIFLRLLQGCEDKSLIAAALPNYTTYNKTGTLDYIRGDAAIVQSENSIMILAITVEGFDDIDQAETIIRTLSLLLEENMRNFNPPTLPNNN